MLARLVLAFSVFALGCGGSSAAAPSSASPPADAGASDAASSDAATAGPDPCAPGTVVPTQLATLDAWPKLDPLTASDLGSKVAVKTTKVPGPPAGVLAVKDGSSVFAAVGPQASGQLGVLVRTGADLKWDHGVALAANAEPFGVAQSASGAFVAVSDGAKVALVDVAKAKSNASGALLASVDDHSAKGTAIDVKLTPDDAFAFVALEYDRAVAVIDVAKRSYVGAVPIAAQAITGVVVSPDGSRVYVVAEAADEFLQRNPKPDTDQDVGSITVIDAAVARTDPAHAVLGHAFVGRAPVRMALTPDGATLWVTLRGSNAIVALATEHLLSTTCTPVRATVAVGPAPVGLALVRGGAGLVVADSNRFAAPSANQTVTIVGTAKALAGAPSVVGQLTVGAFPREVASDGDVVFVSNFNSQSVSGFDLSGVAFE